MRITAALLQIHTFVFDVHDNIPVMRTVVFPSCIHRQYGGAHNNKPNSFIISAIWELFLE